MGRKERTAKRKSSIRANNVKECSYKGSYSSNVKSCRKDYINSLKEKYKKAEETK